MKSHEKGIEEICRALLAQGMSKHEIMTANRLVLQLAAQAGLATPDDDSRFRILQCAAIMLADGVVVVDESCGKTGN